MGIPWVMSEERARDLGLAHAVIRVAPLERFRPPSLET